MTLQPLDRVRDGARMDDCYCCRGECCGPGSWCCAHAGEHEHPELMTKAEHELVELLGECFNRYAGIVGRGDTRGPDLTEFAARIHDLQHAVMAQAAARAYPSRYRLAGGRIEPSPNG